MRTQSASYDPFPAVRRVDMRISFGLLDVSAKGNATPMQNGGGALSNPTQTLNEIYETSELRAGLELNAWILNGTNHAAEKDMSIEEIGLWSNLSDENGAFSGVSMTYSFSAPVSTVGWTLYFDSKLFFYPTKIKITAKDASGADLWDATYEGTGHTQTINAPVQEYSSVTFEFLENSHPYTSVRLVEIDFGIYQRFNKDNIEKASIVYGADIAADSFPSKQLVFSFDNKEKAYNLLNPSGLYAYLQEGQEIAAEIIIDGESVDMGKFFFSNATASNSAITASITASDIAYVLDTDPFMGGSNATTTLSAAVAVVLSGVEIETSFNGYGNRSVVLAIPSGTSKREAIRLLAQAAMCTVWIDRDGVMQFNHMEGGEAVSALTGDELYDFNGVTVTDVWDKVVLTVKNDFAGTQKEYTAGAGRNTKQVSNPCVASSNGSAVASWLLTQYNRRKQYNVKNRGDLAVEIGDTINIEDAYKQNGNAVVTGIDVQYIGGVSATTKAIGT